MSSATKDARPIPDPRLEPIAFLRQHGWTPDGDPRAATTRWLDPTLPEKATTESKEIHRHRDLRTGITKITKQQVFTPGRTDCPLALREAVEIQIDRNLAKKKRAV